MKPKLYVAGALLAATTLTLAPLALAEEVENSDANRPTIGQEDSRNKLSLDEQLKLRAAQQKAVEDPAVKEALAKRDAAVEAFRQALHDSMVKSNPALEAILAKIAVGGSPGF